MIAEADGQGQFEWRQHDLCDYGEECDDAEAAPECRSCGDFARRVSHRIVDGEVTQDCVGCACGSPWSIYECYAANVGPYGEAWIDLVFQADFDVIRLALAADDGAVLYTTCNGQNASLATLRRLK